MGVGRLRQALFVVVAAGLLLGSATVPVRAVSEIFAVPPVESWTECGRVQYSDAITLILCLDPNGDGAEYGATAWSDEPEPVYLGKAWGIRYTGGIAILLERVRVLLRLDDGSDFLGAEGEGPEVLKTKDASGRGMLAIQLLGEDGTIAERSIVLSEQ